jgi:hypothetical protein
MGKKLPQAMRDNMIKPGEVRNPKGRIKGSKNFKTVLREMLELGSGVPHPITGEQLTEQQLLVWRWIENGRGTSDAEGEGTRSDWRAIEALVNRMDGKADQPIKLGEDPDNPISTRLTIDIARQLDKFVEEESNKDEH